MKKTLTLTTLAALFAINAAFAQQASFSFGKDKMVAQLSKSGWEFNNSVASIKNFLYIDDRMSQKENFMVMASPYLNLNANDVVQLDYKFDGAQVGVYSEDFAGNLTRIAELSSKASTQKIVIANSGKQRIIVKLEKNNKPSINLVIKAISFNNYSEVQYTRISGHEMSIKKMQDTPDEMMPMNTPVISSNDTNSDVSAFAGTK